ncbi:hypothetical protein HID58_003191 [Brassica napus]|uniref:S-protein homolog n=1 Tax=Brassica napus TaxID=3708 RepID=A0ABQ8EPR1_BRANA|nr:hypothetical protein HID58_003191 [Brassica napus]
MALSHAQDDFSLTGFDNPETTVVIINDLGGSLPFWENELHYLDIYKQDRDRLFAEFGCRRCEWKIHKNGACKLNKDNGMFDVCLPWN